MNPATLLKASTRRLVLLGLFSALVLPGLAGARTDASIPAVPENRVPITGGWTPTIDYAGDIGSQIAQIASCKKDSTTKVEDPKTKVKDPKNPCPAMQNAPAEIAELGKECKGLVDRLDEAFQKWATANKESCDLANRDTSTCNAGNNCFGTQDKLLSDAKAAADRELAAIDEAVKAGKDVKSMVGQILLLQAEAMKKLEHAEAVTGTDAALPADAEASRAIGSSWDPSVRGDTKVGNATAETNKKLADQILKSIDKGSAPRSSEVTGGDYVQEPAKIAQAASDMQSGLEKRRTELLGTKSQLNGQQTSTQSRNTNLGAVDPNMNGVSSGDPGNTGNGNGGANPSNLAGLANAAGAAAGASQAGAKSTPGSNSYASGPDSTPSTSPAGLGGTNFSDKGKKDTSASSKDFAKAAAAINAKGGNEEGGNSTAASSAGGKSSLRDELRARLGKGTNSGGSMDVSAAASAGAKGEGKGVEKTKSGASTMPPMSEGEVAASAAGGALGNSDFSLAGSETDAFVQSLTADLAGGTDLGGRQLASLGDSGEQGGLEILKSDSPSLFSRTRQTLNRSVKKGLLVTGLKAKL